MISCEPQREGQLQGTCDLDDWLYEDKWRLHRLIREITYPHVLRVHALYCKSEGPRVYLYSHIRTAEVESEELKLSESKQRRNAPFDGAKTRIRELDAASVNDDGRAPSTLAIEHALSCNRNTSQRAVVSNTNRSERIRGVTRNWLRRKLTMIGLSFEY